MERSLGKAREADPVKRFDAAAEALTLAIDHNLRTKGNVDLLALKGEVVMLRLGFRTLIELLAKHGQVQLTEWDKAYTVAIEKETEKVKGDTLRASIVGAVNGGRG